MKNNEKMKRVGTFSRAATCRTADCSVKIKHLRYLIDISVSISNWGSSCKSKQSQAWVDRIVTSKAQSSVCCRFLESSVFLRSPNSFLETWFKIFKMIQAYSSKLCLCLQALISGGCEIFDIGYTSRHPYPICHATALRIIRDCNVRLWTLQAHKVMQSDVAAWLEAPKQPWDVSNRWDHSKCRPTNFQTRTGSKMIKGFGRWIIKKGLKSL